MEVDQRSWAAPAASPQSHPSPTIRNLQLLRAVAAVLVVLFHAQRSASELSGIGYRLDAGAWGVDIFFVISGFIMFHTTAGFRRSGWQFVVDRAIRVVPLYWIATLVLYALYLVGFRPSGVHHATLLDVVTSLLFIPRPLAHGAPVLLSLGWTLIYEFLFYALFAATFAMRSHRLSLVVLSAAFALLGCLPLLAPGLPYTLSYFSNTIAFEFVFGAALALGFARLPAIENRTSTMIGWALIALGLMAIVNVPVHKLSADFAWDCRALRAGIPALAVVTGALLLERAGRVCRSAPLLVLGAASYSLYLFHPFVLQPVMKIIRAAVHFEGWSMILFANLAVLAGTCAMAVAVHFLVEMPVIAALRRRRGRGPAVAATASEPVNVGAAEPL